MIDRQNDRRHVAWDLETTGFAWSDQITVSGFWFPGGHTELIVNYKAIKDFMPRTSSMDYRVRFTDFVFATLIYNLWRLTDYLIKHALDLPIRDDPVVGSRTFARVVGNFLREID